MQDVVIFVLYSCVMFAVLNRYVDNSFSVNSSTKFLYLEIPMILTILQVVIWFIFTFGPDRDNFYSVWLDFGTGYPLVENLFHIDCKTLVCMDRELNLLRTKILLYYFQMSSIYLLSIAPVVQFLERRAKSMKKKVE